MMAEAKESVAKDLVVGKLVSYPLWLLPTRLPAFGLICAVLSVFSFSLQSLIVKMLTNIHTFQILVIRSAFQFVFYALIAICQKHDLLCKPEQRFNLFMRSLTGTIGSFSAFLSFRMIPLSDATSIQFSSPMFVVIIARLILGESVTKLKCITAVCAIVGVFTIAKPEFLFGVKNAEILPIGDVTEEIPLADVSKQTKLSPETRLEGIALAVVSALGMAFATIYIRKLKSAPISLVVAWHSLVSIITGSVLLMWVDGFLLPEEYESWLVLAAIGVLGILAQFFMTMALKHESAGPVSVTNTLTIVLAFIWEIVLFSTSPEWTSILGALMITSSVLLLAIDKWRTEKPDLFSKCCCFNRGHLEIEPEIAKQAIQPEVVVEKTKL